MRLGDYGVPANLPLLPPSQIITLEANKKSGIGIRAEEKYSWLYEFWISTRLPRNIGKVSRVLLQDSFSSQTWFPPVYTYKYYVTVNNLGNSKTRDITISIITVEVLLRKSRECCKTGCLQFLILRKSNFDLNNSNIEAVKKLCKYRRDTAATAI